MRWTSIPSRGDGEQYSQLLHATETGISSGRMGHLGSCATLLYLSYYLVAWNRLGKTMKNVRQLECKLDENELMASQVIASTCKMWPKEVTSFIYLETSFSAHLQEYKKKYNYSNEHAKKVSRTRGRAHEKCGQTKRQVLFI